MIFGVKFKAALAGKEISNDIIAEKDRFRQKYAIGNGIGNDIGDGIDDKLGDRLGNDIKSSGDQAKTEGI
jgi:hypothetical protein